MGLWNQTDWVHPDFDIFRLADFWGAISGPHLLICKDGVNYTRRLNGAVCVGKHILQCLASSGQSIYIFMGCSKVMYQVLWDHLGGMVREGVFREGAISVGS